MARKFHQGRFIPEHPEKYIGDPNQIVYRSSWELRLMKYLDRSPTILKWASEEVHIPYLSPVDYKMHRYFVDFAVMFKNRHGAIKKAMIEVKPNKERKQPVPPKSGRQTLRYLNECKTYSVNQAKWAYATKWCEERGMQFIVLDEYDMGIEKRPSEKRRINGK